MNKRQVIGVRRDAGKGAGNASPRKPRSTESSQRGLDRRCDKKKKKSFESRRQRDLKIGAAVSHGSDAAVIRGDPRRDNVDPRGRTE